MSPMESSKGNDSEDSDSIDSCDAFDLNDCDGLDINNMPSGFLPSCVVSSTGRSVAADGDGIDNNNMMQSGLLSSRAVTSTALVGNAVDGNNGLQNKWISSRDVADKRMEAFFKKIGKSPPPRSSPAPPPSPKSPDNLAALVADMESSDDDKSCHVADEMPSEIEEDDDAKMETLYATPVISPSNRLRPTNSSGKRVRPCTFLSPGTKAPATKKLRMLF